MTTEFKRKVYTQLDASTLSRSLRLAADTKCEKKIVPTNELSGLREAFKKTFLPLLIDVAEMRQMIESYKMDAEGIPMPGRLRQSPKEILNKLEGCQADVEEAQRWCNGVILQISKGIEEAKEALAFLKADREKKKADSLWSKLMKKLHP